MTRRSLPYGLLGGVALLGFAAGSLLDPGAIRLGGLFAKNAAQARIVSERVTPLGAGELSTVNLFERASRSVVFIATSHLKDVVLTPDEEHALPISAGLRAELRRAWLDVAR